MDNKIGNAPRSKSNLKSNLAREACRAREIQGILKQFQNIEKETIGGFPHDEIAHLRLYRLYGRADAALCPEDGEMNTSLERRNAQLMLAQENILDLAIRTRAASPDAAAYKLAMWKISAPDLEPHHVSRSARIAVSVCDDLAHMAGISELLTS